MENKYKYRVALVCDFCYPSQGGVEVHLYQLALNLNRLGCKVIMITHYFKDRMGIRYMGNGLKVYYLPLMTFYNEDTLPMMFTNIKKLREIIISEDLNLIHFHQSTSILGMVSVMQARCLGIPAVYTDHSLFSFGDLAGVSLNKVIKTFLTDIDQCITVSHIGRDNLILRSAVDPRKIHVLPNATDFSKFLPSEVPKSNDPLYIVVVCRHTFRKGIDLLIEIIPMICREFTNVNFIIGGDGPKRILLEKMVDSFGLHNRVELLGSVPHKQVRNIMVRGHIYLNTSLTEAFGIILLEAASSGLFVVSTDIGGIPEVLPKHMMTLVEPNSHSVYKGLKTTIINYRLGLISNTQNFHNELKNYYNWYKISTKTIEVYDKALNESDRSMLTRIKNILSLGRLSAILYLFVVIMAYLIMMILSIVQPKSSIKKEKSFNYKYYIHLLENKYKIKQQ